MTTADYMLTIGVGDSIYGCGYNAIMQAIATQNRGDCTAKALPAKHLQMLAEYRVGAHIYQNFGLGGTRFADADPNGISYIGDNYVQPLLASRVNSRFRPRVIVHFLSWIGSNDGAIGGYGTGNYAQYYAAVAAELNSWRAFTSATTIVSIVSLLPRDDAGGPMNETTRTDSIAWLQNSANRLANGIDYLFDAGSHATMGVKANCSNPVLYDGAKIHPTQTGAGNGASLLATDVFIPKFTAIGADFGITM